MKPAEHAVAESHPMVHGQLPRRRHWLSLLPFLASLETRVLLRSWRWRILALLTIGTCLMLQRTGPGFGEAVAVDFPGGSAGIRVLAALLAGGALLLSLESAGRADRHRMRTLDDARPAPGLLVQASRLLAVLIGTLPLAVVVVLFPFAWRPTQATSLMLSPSLMFAAIVLVPLMLVSATAGLASRSLLRRDLPALAVGGAIVTVTLWIHVWLGRAEDLFHETSRSLGILIPLDDFLTDAGLLALLSAGLFGIAASTTRRPTAVTILKSRKTPKPSRSAIRYLFSQLSNAPRRLASLHALACLVLVIVGAGATARMAGRARSAMIHTTNSDQAMAWDRVVAPPGSDGVVYPPIIASRQWDLTQLEAGTLTGRLMLSSSLREGQSLAAITLGTATVLSEATRSDGGNVSLETESASPSAGVSVLRFDPPLRPDQEVEVRLVARPAASASRDWARTGHHVFRTFETLGPWYGESLLVDYRSRTIRHAPQPAPYELTMPMANGLEWVSGPADSESADGRVVLRCKAPGLPTSLVAAPTILVSRTLGEMPVRFHVLPEHEEIAGQLLVAWEDRLTRLARAFGPPPVPIVLTETPRQVPTSPLSITSARLDELEMHLPKYADYSEPTAVYFDVAFSTIHHDLVRTWFNGSFLTIEDPALLREALITYLHEWCFLRGNTREMPRLLRRDFIIIPWEFARTPGQYPFAVLAAEEPGFEGPALAALRGTDLRPVPTSRLVGFHHMLRGQVGDDAFVRALRRLLQEHRGDRFTVELYRKLMEEESGMDLGRFFDQWLVEGVLPRYSLVEAEVIYAEDPQTRGFVYTTRAIVANKGTGRMNVPILLETDGDRIDTTILLEEQEEKEVVFQTLERPLSIAMDPRGWIMQLNEIDHTTRRPVRPQLYLKRVRQLTAGGS